MSSTLAPAKFGAAVVLGTVFVLLLRAGPNPDLVDQACFDACRLAAYDYEQCLRPHALPYRVGAVTPPPPEVLTMPGEVPCPREQQAMEDACRRKW